MPVVWSDRIFLTSVISTVALTPAQRAARKKRKAEKPLAKREYARGSKKRKVKKLIKQGEWK